MGLRGVKTDEVYTIQQKPGKKSALPLKTGVLCVGYYSNFSFHSDSLQSRETASHLLKLHHIIQKLGLHLLF